MRRIILSSLLSLMVFISYAQVGINSDGSSPESSAMLDVKSTSKGVLVPRMTTTQRTDINSPATGLLVYDNTSGSFWYYNGASWQEIKVDAIPDQITDADGNTKVQVEESSNENRIRFDVNGTEAMVINSDGNVGIGKFPTTNQVDINGTVASSGIQMVDGNQGAGKVMISDANGNGTWVDANDGLPVPNTLSMIPIRYHGSYLYVHPTDNATDVSWTTAQTTCTNLNALGFDDWFLPNKLELDAIHKQSYLITGLSQTHTTKYWSSTEMDASNAYTQRLDYGGPDPDPKTETTGHNCRCVRKN